jgi:hydrogenase maturation protease
MGTRVIGLGQAAAGDDGVGLAVLERIRQIGLPPGSELVEAREATALIELLQTENRVIIVDAVVGHPRVGEVLELPQEALVTGVRGPRPLSTHGVTLGEAIELARTLAAGSMAPEVSLVGVAIALPERYTCGLSPAVQAAIPEAARAVLARIGA